VSDERPESLAAQAAAWVPPWERQQRPPDRAYQAHPADDQPTSDDEDRSGAGRSDDDDDLAGGFEGADPPGYAGTVPPELPPIPGEADGPISVDAPRELDGEPEPEPTEIAVSPEPPLPDPIERAADDDDEGSPVDAPFPADGDDAGDVFDAAAADDVGDDAEIDLPFTEDVPPADAGPVGPADAGPVGPADAGPVGPGDAGPGEAGEEIADAGPVGPVGETADAGPVGRGDETGGPGPGEAGDEAADVAYVAGAADFDEAFRAGLVGSGPPGPAPATPDPADHDAGDDNPDVATGRVRAAVPAQARGKRPTPAVVEAPAPRTDDGVDPAPLDEVEMAAALEAILLVVDEPVAEMQLAQILEQPAERVARVLEDISARYTAAGHGFDLRRAAGGWRLYTRPEYAAYVERFVLDGQSVRLTQAALETLAVVAYKQPVTRSRISAIRGVNCDGVMRTLVTRGLIEECGTEGETGAYLYRTTVLFLEKLGLNSVDQLPPLAPFLPDDVEEVLDASG
jgi:segregation and condensation protein B